MILSKLSILNYKNIAEATLEFSPKVNCLLGNNGMGGAEKRSRFRARCSAERRNP